MKVAIIVCLMVAYAAAQESKCPANQEFRSCGSACPPTCDNPDPQMCTMQCVSGCFCKEGLVKDSKGNCIDPKSCPASNSCPKPHQKYNECGSACPLTCKTQEPVACTEQCVQGCFCEDGYVLDDNGNCVDPKNCPGSSQQCTKPHEKYSDCGSACPKSCSNLTPGPCIALCVQGCFCEEGYIRDDQGNCILEKDCQKPSQRCGQNERWSNDSCVPPPVCQGPRCPNNEIVIMCKIACTGTGGCVCRDGFYRDNKHKCVRLNRCNKNNGSTSRPAPRKSD